MPDGINLSNSYSKHLLIAGIVGKMDCKRARSEMQWLALQKPDRVLSPSRQHPNNVKLSVIVPVHNNGKDLLACLEALATSTRVPDELIVVDDASTDHSKQIAEELGARVIALNGRARGPAFARNRGVEAAHGNVIIFIDADVAAHPDTLAKMEQYLVDQPQVAALFGSYDDAPIERGLVSLFKNLLHHYVHQHSKRQASTFWAGAGAIRREVFDRLGGFDEAFTAPSIEDIELGLRLRGSGYVVWLCPDVQVTHLKKWSIRSLLGADIFARAVPWTRLILGNAGRNGPWRLPSDLNLDTKSRLSALVAWVSVASIALGFVSPLGFVIALLGVAVIASLNFDLYRLFARRGGFRFAVAAFGLHLLYLLYSSLVFGCLFSWHVIRRVIKPAFAFKQKRKARGEDKIY
jgi:GT2 family glycosyltransferase